MPQLLGEKYYQNVTHIKTNSHFCMAKLTQNELLAIFNEVKKLAKPYEKGAIKARIDIEGKYDLWSEKEMMALGKKRTEMAFTAIILQSSYVGFYFMPVYCCDGVKDKLGAELMKTLKGKACFHIKNTDPLIMKQIKEAMKLGYEGYKKLSWV